MSLRSGQKVLLKSAVPIYGTISQVIAEPGGNDSVIVQPDPIRRHASDLELIAAPPTTEEVAAAEARHVAAFKAWESNPSDPNRVEALLVALRELGWLKDLPS
jgi:hypothetical protein